MGQCYPLRTLARIQRWKEEPDQFAVQCRSGNGTRCGISIQQGTRTDCRLFLDETHGFSKRALCHPRWAGYPFPIAVELLVPASVKGRMTALSLYTCGTNRENRRS